MQDWLSESVKDEDTEADKDTVKNGIYLFVCSCT